MDRVRSISQRQRWFLLLPCALFIIFSARGFATDHDSALFRVGFAQRDVTPKRTLTMGGYGVYVGFRSATRTNGEGVHDPLTAGAVAIDDEQFGAGIILLTVDSVGLSARSLQRIRERTPEIAKDFTIVVSATHTHSAPDTMGLWGALPFFSGRDAAYMSFLERECAEAIREAVAAMQMSTLRFANGRHANSTSLGDGKNIDDHFATVFAYDQDEHMIGSFTQWSAHPTILNQDNNSISSDFPGLFRHYMTANYPGTHLFFNGTLGRVYTADQAGQRPDPYEDWDLDPHAIDGYKKVAFQAHALFEAVSSLPQQILTDSMVRVKNATALIPNENRLFRLASSMGIIERLPQKRGKMLSELVWAQIGAIQLVTVPGEIFPEAALWLKGQLEARGAVVPMLIGMSQNWLGYLMSPEDCADGENRYFKTLSISCRSVPILKQTFSELLARP